MSNPEDASVFGDEDNNPFPPNLGLTDLAPSHNNNYESNPSATPHDYDGFELDFDTSGQPEDELLVPNTLGHEQSTTIYINHENRVSKILSLGATVKIDITNAAESNEGLAKPLRRYVVYTIRVIGDSNKDEVQTRRRYSDFESLRDVLVRIFPLLMIPPIPPKNYSSLNMLNGLVGSSVTSHVSTQQDPAEETGSPNSAANGKVYSYINSNHLNSNRLIDHRKRLLANFLNLCLRLSEIRSLDFFAKFLDPSANWSDEISLIMSQLPRLVYQLNPENGLHTDPLYSELPLPNQNHALSILFLKPKKVARKASRFLGSGDNGNPENTSSPEEEESENLGTVRIKTSHLDDINKKIMGNFIGLSNDYAEFGTVLNSFSLMLIDIQKVKVGGAIEKDETKLDVVFDKVSTAFDRSCVTINSLISELETQFSEPLGESVQYSSVVQSIRKFHDRKVKQRDILDQEISEKRSELAGLTHAEVEAAKVENAISSLFLQSGASHPVSDQSPPAPNGNTKSSLFSLKKITKYVSDIMDQNPEQTRQQRLTYLRKQIGVLEQCQKIMLSDSTFISEQFAKTLRNFRRTEARAIFDILLSYNRILVGWARKNIEIWGEIREEILKLED